MTDAVTAAPPRERGDDVLVRRILDQLYAFVGITALDGTLIEANRAPLEAAGIRAADVLGKPFWEAWWWSYDAAVQQQLKTAIARAAGGETVRYDVPIRVAGGRFATIDFQIAPLRDDSGHITHLVPSGVIVEDRVRVRAELQRRIAQLRSVYDGVPVGLAFHDRALRFIEINDALAQINGLPVEAHLGRSVAEILPLTAKDIVPLQQRVIETGEALEGVEVHTQTAAGDGERDYLISYTPARDDQGEVMGLTVAVVDITDRKAAERQISAERERYRAAFENAAVGMAEVGLDGSWLRVNRRLCEIVGYGEPELRRLTFQDITHPDDLDSDLELLRKVLAGALQTYTLEKRYRHRDGRWIWIELTVSLVRDPGGEPAYFISVVQDISARKQAEAALQQTTQDLGEREARYRALITSIEAGFSLVELLFDEAARPVDYRFLEVNPAFERQTGLTDPVGHTARALIPGLEEHWVQTYGRVATSGEPVRFESGSEGLGRWFDVYAVPVGAEPPYRVGILFNDVTVRRRAEDEVRRLNRNLERLVEERTQRLEETVSELDAFAHTVSHDLRAPLRGIEGFARILNEEHAHSLSPTGQRYAQRIYAAAERMDQLIQDLLSYSRLSRADIEVKPVDLEAVIDAVIADHRAVIEAAGARLMVERPMPAVLGNRIVLGQIIANLLTNAIKFVGEGVHPEVHIRAEPVAGRVRLWVEDNGIGVEEEFRSRIFNVFERLHGQEHYSGTGIGLAIVKKGAERLGGAAGVEGGTAGGARFWVDLRAEGDEQ